MIQKGQKSVIDCFFDVLFVVAFFFILTLLRKNFSNHFLRINNEEKYTNR